MDEAISILKNPGVTLELEMEHALKKLDLLYKNPKEAFKRQHDCDAFESDSVLDVTLKAF